MNGDEVRFRRLGYRAFWMFFIRNSRPMLSVAGLILILGSAQRNLLIREDIFIVLNQTLALLTLVFMVTVLGTLAASFIGYIAYEYALDEHSLKIRRGILNIDIEAIPYRQMQNIDIERDLIYRFLGLSRLVILTAGTEDAETKNESEGVIPAIDKHLAAAIQAELLKRANLERVVVTQMQNGTSGPAAV